MHRRRYKVVPSLARSADVLSADVSAASLKLWPKINRSWCGMNKIRCLVVDDHVLLRQGVRRLLEGEPDFEVVGDAGDASEALQSVRDLQPDIVLMDIGMSGMSSFEAVRIIRKEHPATKVVFLTMFEDEDYLMQCLDAGASGYVLKD